MRIDEVEHKKDLYRIKTRKIQLLLLVVINFKIIYYKCIRIKNVPAI